MQPKVLLINPIIYNKEKVVGEGYPPIGLLYIATYLKNNNINTAVIDINHGYNNIIAAVKYYKPDIVGIGCSFSGAFKNLKDTANLIKSLYPNIPIVVGGIHPTAFAKEILEKYNFIDYVIIGEGEEVFYELVKSIFNKTPLPSSINGIAFRKEKEITLSPKLNFIENLDKLPQVNYEFLDIDNYYVDTKKWFSPKKIEIKKPFFILSSRSCSNKCTFCSMYLVHGTKIRFRSANNVLDEMEYLYNGYGTNYFHFIDDNLTYDKQRILDICKGIKDRDLNIQFDTPNGIAINKLDKEILDAMMDAGLVEVSLGIESGSDFIRNKCMKKGLSTKKIFEIVNMCANYKNLFIKGFFIIGMPQETKETLEETYKMITYLPLDKISCSYAAPYPGTELFKYCTDNNLLSYKIEDYVDTEVLQDTDERPHLKPHNLSIEELIKFREKCFNYMKEKRSKIKVPNNYPLRYEGSI